MADPSKDAVFFSNQYVLSSTLEVGTIFYYVDSNANYITVELIYKNVLSH